MIAFGRGRRGTDRGSECRGGVSSGTDIDGRGVVFAYDPTFEDCCGEAKIGGVRLNGREWKVYARTGNGGRGCGDEPCPRDLNLAPVLDGRYLYRRRSVYTRDNIGEGITRLTLGPRPAVVDFLQFRRPQVFTVDRAAVSGRPAWAHSPS